MLGGYAEPRSPVPRRTGRPSAPALHPAPGSHLAPGAPHTDHLGGGTPGGGARPRSGVVGWFDPARTAPPTPRRPASATPPDRRHPPPRSGLGRRRETSHLRLRR